MNADGTVARNRGVTSATRLAAGAYEVIFNQNIRNCAWTVSRAQPGFIVEPDPGEIGVTGRFNNVNGVWVETWNSAGANADHAFVVAVSC